MRKITKLLLTAMLLVAGVGTVNADIKIHLNDLKAANGTDEAWLAAIPASYPLNVLDNVLFGSDANNQVTNANVNGYDYLYFKITNFVSPRAVRVFFWDPTADKRIDYFLKPIADKETADYAANTTVSDNGTYCVKIPAGARLQGAKTTWTASPTADPYFAIEEIYMTQATVSLADLKAANGTDDAWQAAIPASYPLNVLDNVLFGSDANNQVTNANVNGYDYLYFKITNFVSPRAVRVFFWDPTADKRIDYFLKPIADKETADYAANTTVSDNGTYCVRIPTGARLQGAKTPWTASAAVDPYFAIEDIYLIEHVYIEASEQYAAPAGTTDINGLSRTSPDYTWTVTYPKVISNETEWCGHIDSDNKSADISAYDYLHFVVTDASADAHCGLRVFVWDGSTRQCLYPRPIAEATGSIDWKETSWITSPGVYVVKISGNPLLRGFKALQGWAGNAGTITVSQAYLSSGDPVDYIPSGKYTLVGEGVASASLTTALADANATYYDATGVTGTGVDLTGAANPNALFKANAGVLANTNNVIVDGTCANLVLTDNYPFQAPSNFTATAASYSTTINTTAQCGTLCLPFAATIPGGVTAYTLSYVSGNDAATLTPVETTIPANTPVLLNGSGAATFTGSGAVNADATNVSGALTGVFANTAVPLNSYVLQNGASGIGFYKVASDITAKPFRAYLTGQVAGSKDFLSINFDEATAISQVQGSGFKVQDSEIFNLAGQRMSKLQKGVNIVNGKKVMVK